jgi:hypothetical protein
MAEVRTVGEKMVEARMVGRLSQVLVKEKTAAAAMKARGAARSVQQRRS